MSQVQSASPNLDKSFKKKKKKKKTLLDIVWISMPNFHKISQVTLEAISKKQTNEKTYFRPIFTPVFVYILLLWNILFLIKVLDFKD